MGEGLKAERVGGAGDEAGGTQAKRGRTFSGEGAEGILLPRSEDLILALTAPGLRGAGGRVGIREGLTRPSGAPAALPRSPAGRPHPCPALPLPLLPRATHARTASAGAGALQPRTWAPPPGPPGPGQ